MVDLSTKERLAAAGLMPPTPYRQTWAAYQQVGQQLFEDGWAGVVAPSAARPKSLIACVFMTDWPPAGCKQLDATTVAAVPPRPRGMAT